MMNSEMCSSHFESAWERIKQVTGWADYKELAQFVGSTSQSISGVKKRGKFPLEWAHRIAKEFGSFTDYLMDGEGPMRRGDTGVIADAMPHYRVVPAEDVAATGAELSAGNYVMVPRLEIEASAGGGAVVHAEQIVDYIGFKEEWVRNTLSVSAQSLALISVKGDSMEPTLSDGDLILVDTNSKKIEASAIYVIQFWGSLLVKRVQRKLDGTVTIKSDNPAYETEVVAGEMIEQLNVVGRVVWYGRRA